VAHKIHKKNHSGRKWAFNIFGWFVRGYGATSRRAELSAGVP
jgi:hypothetical protein